MVTHLIFIEHDQHGIIKSSLSAVTAARLLKGDVHGIILGKNINKVALELAHYVDKLHVGEHDGLEYRLAQPYAKVIAHVAKKIAASHIWASATVAGKDMMPRVAIRLNAAMASDIQEVISENTFSRPVWAGDRNISRT